ncbi:Phr family secreted Rap phosphatase inhibitor [Bacillus wiedmannii]|uniref:Phr family secreted Rap phosphatase inhibitor n=1 Tax=Bacillus wiedmannii TaxID=1890302 RepID=A0A2C5G3R6_9BACI|nr:Phr family secreted Rap phosphatase inhibitor [Bacillus wiedmannii]PEK03093.1 Phr family secreted Rap phosphatase inhibitor [Bacillus wiedmannii]PEL84744.1 Phr family secreted Rap phosphatase inhibitor [Bacillus wiedmannii]PEM93504.1 Phr family secreted Rap phosphatase inhibitor [Bacillus wiedmannii]PEO85655.1 Phr family secreted Rap phosphatase inhibitor [Bacillus wiedmannii]PEP26190.1 Phr family secreted Rap phosphatase inhibitor [Bacillus wiedmannii]
MKKVGVIAKGLIFAGILSFGFNFPSTTQQAVNIGDGGAPTRPDYINIGDTGGAPANFNKGDGGAPADNRGDGEVSQL